MAELDQGYKNLISVILNLNHDRYKSYFNYFIVLHLGLITAFGSDFSKDIHCFRQFLILIGIILAIAWFLVQFKIIPIFIFYIVFFYLIFIKLL